MSALRIGWILLIVAAVPFGGVLAPSWGLGVPAAWAEEEEEEEGEEGRALVTTEFQGDLKRLAPNGKRGPRNRAYVSNERRGNTARGIAGCRAARGLLGTEHPV